MIRTLVVDDDPIAAAVHAGYVNRVPGFVAYATAGTATSALRVMTESNIGLVLLEVHLSGASGLEVLRKMRAAGRTTDAIIVTRIRHLAAVRTAVLLGANQYLVKPFTFSLFRSKLENVREYHARLHSNHVLGQSDVDELVHGFRFTADGGGLPKGISRESLGAVAQALKAVESCSGLAAFEVAETLGASRVTARRYLEYLVELGLGSRHTRYGTAGRPQIEYRWCNGLV